LKPYSDRTADTQYQDRLRFILEKGEFIAETPQGTGAYTVFGALPPMVFNLENGAPLITERKIGFWRKAIAEILAFASGVHTFSGLKDWGCDWWQPWAQRSEEFGLVKDDLGPGSYGAAFHDFPMAHGQKFDQFAHLIEQIKKFPYVRTAFISPWIPYYIGRGGYQKAVVSPCHGWIHVRVINGKLCLNMWQRSADFPIGVPANMIQYAALTILLARVTGYEVGTFTHQFGDAHIYDNQVEGVKEMLGREPRFLPTLTLHEGVTSFELARARDFTLTDYHPHPPIDGIPVGI